jgi:hypothetical protein
MLSLYAALGLGVFTIVGIAGWHVPRIAARAALAAGSVAIADAAVFFIAYSESPRERDSGCIEWHGIVYDLAWVFFLVGAAAAVVAAAAGLAAAMRRERPVRSLLFGAAGLGAGFGCFVLVILIAVCGD